MAFALDYKNGNTGDWESIVFRSIRAGVIGEFEVSDRVMELFGADFGCRDGAAVTSFPRGDETGCFQFGFILV